MSPLSREPKGPKAAFRLEQAIVLDTETTGLTVGRDEILSIAIVDVDGNELLNSFVKPDHHTSWPSAQRINGISPEMVQAAPSIHELKARIRSLVNGEHLIVAYNARFDLGMLRSLSVIDRIPLSNTFDIMREFALVHGSSKLQGRPGYRWSRLEDCARYYGYTFAPHSALEDARATAFCFGALMNDEGYRRHTDYIC